LTNTFQICSFIVQNIINGDAVRQKEYLHFIDAETVSIEELCSVLNRARLIHKLYLLSSDVMKAYHIQADGSKFKPFTKNSLLCYLQEMQLNISEILNQIQKKYNTLLDIDDEEEYQKIQSETREKRKKFRLLNQLCQEYYQAVENYVPVTAAVPENIPEPVKAEPVPKKSELTEEAFLNWLLNSQSVSEKTAKNTIAYLREAEKVYYLLFGAEEKIFGVSSKEKAEEIFTKFMNYDAFQEINSKRNYDFSSAFNKFMQFAGINKKSKDLIDSKKSEASEPVLDTPAPFVLKDAMITILSGNDDRINRNRGYKNGLTAKILQDLIKYFYNKTISIFEISSLLMTDTSFLSVGRGCFIIRQTDSDMNSETEKEEISVQPEHKKISGKIVEILRKNIVETIRENKDNLEYQDGFSAYEVKNLLSNKGFNEASEEEIEKIMASSDVLTEIEDGYYCYCEENSDADIKPVSETPTEAGHIRIMLNGNQIRVYDNTDALLKIAEFAIRYKPFEMARISEQGFCIHDSNVFCRQAAPIDGYQRLSNGLQMIEVHNKSDLKTIANQIKQYCQISDDMISILSE